MQLYDGFVSSMNSDEIFHARQVYGAVNESAQAMDIVPGFPMNKQLKYDQALMIKAIQNGMIILIKYRGTTGKSKDNWKGGRERIIQPMNLGVNKNTGNELLRAWHVEGYSVSQKKNVNKVWRLFITANIKSMMFTGLFFRLPPSGYRMNDRVMTYKKICHADFITIRRNQDNLIKAGKIESEESVTISKEDSSITTSISIKNTGTVIDLSKPWDNANLAPFKNKAKDVKISILKSVFGNDYLAIAGAQGTKNKTVKVFDDKKLLGSYKTVESFTGDQFGKYKTVNGVREMDLYLFIKKL